MHNCNQPFKLKGGGAEALQKKDIDNKIKHRGKKTATGI